MKPRRIAAAIALIAAAALLLSLPGVLKAEPEVAGLQGRGRTLLRVWIISSPGGGQAWLTSQLRAFERQNPGVLTHLRIVPASEVFASDAVLPDVILHMPGDLSDPARRLAPVTAADAIRAPLLRCGSHQGTLYGLPLCWGAWVLAIDSALDPVPAATPEPASLWGRPAATEAPREEPAYPLAAASSSETPLLSPGGAALLTLAELLPPGGRPSLPEASAQLSPADAYAAFQTRKCASAMLTTGQVTAFSSLVSAGKGFPFRIMTPAEVVTDLVWLGSVTQDAPPEAAALLAFLTGTDAQRALAAQGLHTVRDDLTLYAAGFSARVEQAGQQGLHAVNAYLPPETLQSAAWQVFQGTLSSSDALPPLL